MRVNSLKQFAGKALACAMSATLVVAFAPATPAAVQQALGIDAVAYAAETVQNPDDTIFKVTGVVAIENTGRGFDGGVMLAMPSYTPEGSKKYFDENEYAIALNGVRYEEATSPTPKSATNKFYVQPSEEKANERGLLLDKTAIQPGKNTVVMTISDYDEESSDTYILNFTFYKEADGSYVTEAQRQLAELIQTAKGIGRGSLSADQWQKLNAEIAKAEKSTDAAASIESLQAAVDASTAKQAAPTIDYVSYSTYGGYITLCQSTSTEKITGIEPFVAYVGSITSIKVNSASCEAAETTPSELGQYKVTYSAYTKAGNILIGTGDLKAGSYEVTIESKGYCATTVKLSVSSQYSETYYGYVMTPSITSQDNDPVPAAFTTPTDPGTYTASYKMYTENMMTASHAASYFDGKVKVSVAGGALTATILNSSGVSMVDDVALGTSASTLASGTKVANKNGAVEYTFSVTDLGAHFKLGFGMTSGPHGATYKKGDYSTYTLADFVFEGVESGWSSYDAFVSFGSRDTELLKGAAVTNPGRGTTVTPTYYSVPIKMLNASDSTKDSMAADAIPENALLSVDDTGAAKLRIHFDKVELKGITGYASDIKALESESDTTGTPATVVATQKTGAGDERPLVIELPVLNNSVDRIAISMHVDAMGSDTNALLDLSYPEYVLMSSGEAAALEAADSAAAKIPEAGKIALSDKAAVQAARSAYDALSDAQKKLTSDLLIVTAEAKIKELQDAADKAAAQKPAPVADGAGATASDGSAVVATSATTVEYKAPTASAGKKVTVPDTVTLPDGTTRKVTSIAANAFKGAKATQVALGANIERIAAGAFKGSKVKKLTIASTKLTKKSVKGAFKGAKKLTTVKVPKSVKKKYKKVFAKKVVGKKVAVK